MNKWFYRLDYGRWLLQQSSLKSITFSDLYLMSGYLLSEQTPIEEIRNIINDKISDKFTIYHEKEKIKMINKCIDQAIDRPVENLSPISISQKELDTIKNTLVGSKDQKLAFTLLCFAKYYNALTGNDSNWISAPSKVLFESAGVHVSKEVQNQIIYRLKSAGLITNSMKITSNNIKVNFVDEDMEDKVLEISDLRGLGAIYLHHLGGSYMQHKVLKHCKECGIPFIDGSKKNNALYCTKCKKNAI